MKISFVAFGLISIVSCNLSRSPVPRDIAGTKPLESKIDSIKGFIVSSDTAKKSLSLPGTLIANEQVQVRAKVQGYIRKLNVDLGSKVSTGQVLAWIDAPEMNIRLKELNEKVFAANSRFQSSKDYFERISIASKTEGVIAPSEINRAKNLMLADSSEYNAVLLAASGYSKVDSYLAILAPFNGIITKRNIELGSFVGTINEKPLFELEDNSILRLSVPVPEIYSGASLSGNACELTTRAFPDKKFKAKLVRKSSHIDEDTRSELWEFEIPNADRMLKAGSYADAKLNFRRAASSWVVPVSAVVTTLERKFIIKSSNHITQWIDVRTGFNMGDKIEVFGDIKTGDTMVVKATEELKAGTAIAIKTGN